MAGAPLRSRTFRNHGREYTANHNEMRHTKSDQNPQLSASVFKRLKWLSILLKIANLTCYLTDKCLPMT